MNAYFLRAHDPKTYAQPCSYNIRMNVLGNLHNVSHQQRFRKQQTQIRIPARSRDSSRDRPSPAQNL